MPRTRFTPSVCRLEGRITPTEFVPSPLPAGATIPPPPWIAVAAPATSDLVYDPSIGGNAQSVSLPYRMQDGVLKPLIQVVEP
jgi:hypothetical protein